MAYRDQVAQLEHQLARAEKRAARAEASTPRRRRLLTLSGALVLCVAAAGAGYALAPTGEERPVVLDGHGDARGALRQSTWRATRGEQECYLIADDHEERHQATLARRLTLRLFCGETLVYETPQLRYGERLLGGCISQTGRSANDHRLVCSERVVNHRGGQRGPALSADSVGHLLQITDEAGGVQEWHLQSRPYRRSHYREETPLRAERGVTFSAEANIRQMSGSPMVHGVAIPRITGRSSCEVRVRSAAEFGVDARCELRVECDDIQLYSGDGQCFHRGGSLQTFADYEPTRNSVQRQGRQTPVAVLDVALGILRLADQDRLHGFSLTLEMQRPMAALAAF
ncbi:MAG: hypothetical protein AB8H86_18835 [Polyangiales bacterium]